MKTAKRLKKQMNEIFLLEPNNLGFWPLTSLFKRTTKPLKTMPFIIIIPVTFIIALIMYLIFGNLLIKLVSLLQYGF